MSQGMGRTNAILVALAILVLLYFAGYYMPAAVLTPMRKEGLIPGTKQTWRFYASLLRSIPGYVGLALTFVWGVLADKIGRPRLLFVLGLVMGSSLVLVGLAHSYLYLLLVLTIFGIAQAGTSPVIYAFIPDITPPERRGVGYAAYYAASVLGFASGMVIGGILLYWRTAFIGVGLALILVAIPLYMLSRGIRIGYAEQATPTTYSLRGALRAIRNRTVLLMMGQIVPWAIPWGFITYYAVTYLQTRWGIPRGLASGILALAALSIALGHVIGGKLADNLVRKGDVNGRVKVSVIGISIGFLAMLGMLAYPYPYGSTSIHALLPPVILALTGLIFTTFPYPNINSVISDCVRPEYRGTVFSLYNILNGTGWATGPLLYGILSEYFMRSYPERTAVMYAAVSIESLWIISLVIWLLVAKTYPRDRISAEK